MSQKTKTKNKQTKKHNTFISKITENMKTLVNLNKFQK